MLQIANQVIDQQSRRNILRALAIKGETAYTDLLDIAGLTSGNLTAQLKILEKEKFVNVKRSFLPSGMRRTTYSLSKKGREQYLEYLDTLVNWLEEAKISNN